MKFPNLPPSSPLGTILQLIAYESLAGGMAI